MLDVAESSFCRFGVAYCVVISCVVDACTRGRVHVWTCKLRLYGCTFGRFPNEVVFGHCVVQCWGTTTVILIVVCFLLEENGYQRTCDEAQVQNLSVAYVHSLWIHVQFQNRLCPFGFKLRVQVNGIICTFLRSFVFDLFRYVFTHFFFRSVGHDGR